MPFKRAPAWGRREAFECTSGVGTAGDGDHTAPHPDGEGAGLLTPGPYAVAYHLIQAWCDEEEGQAAGQRSATVGPCLVSGLVAAGFALGCVASRAGWVAT